MTESAREDGATISPLSARRDHILVSASEVFTEKGYHNASMDDIAARAGISKPLVYQHFPGKRDLYLGLLDLSVEIVASGIEAAVAQHSSNRQRLEAAVRFYFDAVATADRDFRIIFESDFTQDPDVQSRVDNLVSRLARTLGQSISKQTGFPVERANIIAAGLGGMAQAAAFRWIRLGKPMTKDEAIEEVTHLAWLGLSSLPSESSAR